MHVDVPNDSSEQFVPLDELENLKISGDACLRKTAQMNQSAISIAKIANGKFSDHEWVREHLSDVEILGEQFVLGTKMVDPD